MRSQWQVHKGQKIIFANYARLGGEAFAKEIGEVLAEVLKLSPQSAGLMLVDVEGMVIGPQELELFKDAAAKCKPVVRKTAVLGVTGAKKTLFDIVITFSKLPARAFETRAQAEDWLVQEG